MTPLRFTTTPGPLLQIVGVCGGAGVSTLSYLLALTAAERSTVPVLVCDTGGPTAGLALYANAQAPRTLAELSELLAERETFKGALFATTVQGLRVLAREPQFTVDGDEQGIRRLLNDARNAHGLCVIDGGTLARHADRVALTQATHVAWLLPASTNGLQRAERFLERIAPLGCPELIVARAEPHERKPSLDALADIADMRRAPLVLMPHIDELADKDPSEVAHHAQLTIEAIGGLLRR